MMYVRIYSSSVSFAVFCRYVLEYVAWLAFQYAADGRKGGKTHGFGFACFQYGQVGGGDVHFFGQLAERHFPLRHHDVYVYYYGHGTRYSDG